MIINVQRSANRVKLVKLCNAKQLNVKLSISKIKIVIKTL